MWGGLGERMDEDQRRGTKRRREKEEEVTPHTPGWRRREQDEGGTDTQERVERNMKPG